MKIRLATTPRRDGGGGFRYLEATTFPSAVGIWGNPVGILAGGDGFCPRVFGPPGSIVVFVAGGARLCVVGSGPPDSRVVFLTGGVEFTWGTVEIWPWVGVVGGAVVFWAVAFGPPASKVVFLTGRDGFLAIEVGTVGFCPGVDGCPARTAGPDTGFAPAGGVPTDAGFMARVPAVPSLVFGSFEFLSFFPKQRQPMASL